MNSKSKPINQCSRIVYPVHAPSSRVVPNQSVLASKVKQQPFASYRPSGTPDPAKRPSCFKEKAPVGIKHPNGLIKDRGENHHGLNTRTPDKINPKTRRSSLPRAVVGPLPITHREEIQAKKSQPSEHLSGFKSRQKNCYLKSGLFKDRDLPERSQGFPQRKSGPDFKVKEQFRKSSVHDVPSQQPQALDPLHPNRPLSQKRTATSTRPINAQRHIAIANLGRKSSRQNSQPPKSSQATSSKPTPTTQTSCLTSINVAASQNDALKVFIVPIFRNLDENQIPSAILNLSNGPLVLAKDKSSRLCQYNLMAKCLCGLKAGERTWFLAVNLFELATMSSDKFVNDWESTALACFLVASKFESVRSPDIYDIVHCSGSEIKPRSILAFEASILCHFDYRIVMTLTYDYYVTLSSIVLSQKKAKDIGLFMLMIFHCSQTDYQTDKALIAFSLCFFLVQRFKEPIFWNRYCQGQSEYYGFKIQKEFLEPSADLTPSYDYSFEVEKVDRTCERITEACLGCKVEEHSWIFSLFAGDKYKCGQK